MKLSDAIALGRTAVIPRIGKVLEADGGGCALGMAGVAAGIFAIGTSAEDQFMRLHSAFPWAVNDEPPCPCKCPHMQHGYKASGIVAHIFDTHVMTKRDWTLDQLIDWVRSVEPAEPEACRCGESFATYDLLLDHIANGKRETGPHVSVEAEKAFARAEADWLERPVGG